MDIDTMQSYGVLDTTENLSSTVNNSVDSSQAGIDFSANENDGNEANNMAMTGLSDNGNPLDEFHGSAYTQQLGGEPALSAEEERLWSIVGANSLDFSAWTALIDETEKVAEQNILKIRKVYDAFLAEFPLCYGYWKKYADHESRIGSIEKVVDVYERAVQGVTYSVDMWLHYCIFATASYVDDADYVRRLFERGLEYVGTDYQSYPLWDMYIEYEYMKRDWPRLASIYTRILENPIQQLDRYFDSFKELAGSRPLSELRTAEEAAAAVNLESRVEEMEGETNPNDVENLSEPVSANSADAEELEKYIAVREEIYKKSKEFDSKISGFEAVIRRPYFHVLPLNVPELENWHNYLDFIEGVGDISKVVKLYERCLIACANYPEFWRRYVLCMEASGCMDVANNALTRATQVFVKRQPEIHLFAARFKEHNGDIPGARASYQLVHFEISPGLLEAITKHANMEHRLGNLEDACSVYEQAIAIEKGKEQSQALPFLFAQYSRFLLLASKSAEKAREVLVQAVESVQLSKPLLEAFIHLELIVLSPKQIEYLDSLVEKFVVPSADSSSVASISEREDLSCIYLEFLDLFGDAKFIKKADHRHSKLFLQHKSTPDSKKRSADDYLSSEKSKLAKSHSGVAVTAPSVMGAYPQGQWGAGYAQTWPQTQAHQYPGYAPQAAYGAYGAYGSSYAHPQVAASVPQTAAYPQVAASVPQTTAYGAYPPYPVQGALQQAYAQLATSAVLTPPQPPVPVPTHQPPQPPKLPPFLMANNQQDAMVTPNIFKVRDVDMWLRLHQDMCSTQTSRPEIPNSTLTECTGATNKLPTKVVKLASSTSGVPFTAGRSKDSMYISFRIPNGDRKWYHLDLAGGDKLVNENSSKHKLITTLLDESSLDKHSYGAYTELNSSIYKMVHKYTPNCGGNYLQVLATESLEGLSWKKFTPFSKYRVRPWVVSMGGKIYVVGAENKGCNLMGQYEINDIEVLTHPESGKWESLPVRSPKIIDWLDYFVVASEDYNKLIMGSLEEQCLLLYDVSTHQLERIDLYGYFPWSVNIIPVVVGKSLFMFSRLGMSVYDLEERCFWYDQINKRDNYFFQANCNENETPALVYLGGSELCLICFKNDIKSTVVTCLVFSVPEFREKGGNRSLLERVDYIRQFRIGYTDHLLNVLLL